MKNCAQEGRGVIEAGGGRVTPGEGMPVVVGVIASPATQTKISTTVRTFAFNRDGFVVDADAYAIFKKISEKFSLSAKTRCS